MKNTLLLDIPAWALTDGSVEVRCMGWGTMQDAMGQETLASLRGQLDKSFETLRTEEELDEIMKKYWESPPEDGSTAETAIVLDD